MRRVLKPDGQFITQQVGDEEEADLNALLGANVSPYAFWTLDYAVNELQEAGWHIVEQREAFSVMRFYDVGAVVYYLKAIPWQVPDFSVEPYFEKLITIHNQIEEQGYIDFSMHRFLIVAVPGR